MSTVDRVALVTRWRSFAADDLHVAASSLRERHGTSAWVVCFHAQQAAEKAIKAVLVTSGGSPPPTHNLVALAALMPHGFRLPVSDLILGTLTTYAVAVRYVMSEMPDEPLVDWDEATSALSHAEAIVAACTTWHESP